MDHEFCQDSGYKTHQEIVSKSIDRYKFCFSSNCKCKKGDLCSSNPKEEVGLAYGAEEISAIVRQLVSHEETIECLSSCAYNYTMYP